MATKAKPQPRVSRKTPVGQAEDLAKKIRESLIAERDERGIPRSAHIDRALDDVEKLAMLLLAINATDSEIEKKFRERFGYGPKR